MSCLPVLRHVSEPFSAIYSDLHVNGNRKERVRSKKSTPLSIWISDVLPVRIRPIINTCLISNRIKAVSVFYSHLVIRHQVIKAHTHRYYPPKWTLLGYGISLNENRIFFPDRRHLTKDVNQRALITSRCNFSIISPSPTRLYCITMNTLVSLPKCLTEVSTPEGCYRFGYL